MLLLNRKLKILQIVSLLIVFTSNIFSLQLGDGTKKNTTTFIKVMDDVKQVSTSFSHNTFVIKNDDTLWVTGSNYNDYLGLGIERDIHSFTKMMDDVKSISGNLIIKNDDSLWYITWNTRNGIVKIDDNVLKASGGDSQDGIMYIKKDHSLWAIGKNKYGSFGLGKKEENLTKPACIRQNVIDIWNEAGYSLILTSEHILYISGCHYLPEPYKWPLTTFTVLARNVRAISDGFYITEENVLYGFGYSYYGALGVGITDREMLPTKVMENVKEVSSDQQSTLILTIKGELYGCGGKTPNYYGELGFGDKQPVLYPKYIMNEVKSISVGNCHTAVIKNDDTLWECGANNYPALM